MTARRFTVRLPGRRARATMVAPAMLGAVLLAGASVLPAAAPAAAQAKNEVQGTASFKWEPAQLRVKPGDTVTFRVAGGGPHPVVSGDGSKPAGDGKFTAKGCAIAQMTATGASCKVKFAKAGTFPYFCSVHVAAGMKGTIVVGEGGGATEPGGGAAGGAQATPTPTASPDTPAAATTAAGKPGIYYAGWGLLAVGGVLALAAVAGYLRFQPDFRRERK